MMRWLLLTFQIVMHSLEETLLSWIYKNMESKSYLMGDAIETLRKMNQKYKIWQNTNFILHSKIQRLMTTSLRSIFNALNLELYQVLIFQNYSPLVYIGAPNIKNYEPQPGSILLASDFKSTEELAKEMIRLSQNEEEYQKYLRVKFHISLNQSTKKLVSQINSKR
jgi:hypothetical protein